MLARVFGCNCRMQRVSAMSNKAIDWVIARKDITSSQKFVALIFANHADPRGTCFPSLETVAREASLSIDTVYRCVKELEAKGLVFRADVRGHRKDGSRKSPLTVVLFSPEASTYAASLGFDQKLIANRRAMTSVVGQPSKLRPSQPCKLPLGQPSKVRFSYIEPPKLKNKSSKHRPDSQCPGGVWIRKGTQEWFSWCDYHFKHGHTWIFDNGELRSFTSKQGQEGRFEATLLPPSSVQGRSQC